MNEIAYQFSNFNGQLSLVLEHTVVKHHLFCANVDNNINQDLMGNLSGKTPQLNWACDFYHYVFQESYLQQS